MKILYYTTLSKHLTCLEGLARCMGVQATVLDIGVEGAIQQLTVQARQECGDTIVIDVASVANRDCGPALGDLLELAQLRGVSTMLLVADISDAIHTFLRTFSCDTVSGVKRLEGVASVRFPASASGLNETLSTHSYPRKTSSALVFDLKESTDLDILMSLGGAPSFVHHRLGKGGVFFWSAFEVFDPFRPLAAELEFEQSAEAYVPAIIFLRHSNGARCWHSPVIGAGLVIDDPLLVQRYGFLDFPRLLASARKHKYHVTLAFIPWNFRRTHPRNAEFFREYSDCFDLCAHGCDHTRNEFHSTDYDDLLRRNHLACERMSEHQNRTGLPCQPLMVCPQEQYSLVGMRAFADSRRFLGLVNTGCLPRDLSEPQACGADLLLPAQDSFFGFPVFKRHYWSDISVFAMAIFLGKPAIMVAHHQFFEEGPYGVEDFVVLLRKLAPAVEWAPLDQLLTRTHWVRESGKGRREVRFFTTVFHLRHGTSEAVVYQFFKRLAKSTPVRRVLVNGRDVPFEWRGGDLTFELRQDRNEALEIRLEIDPVRSSKQNRGGFGYRSSVALRRGLSEFRDNVVARNGTILRTCTSLMKALKQTGGK